MITIIFFEITNNFNRICREIRLKVENNSQCNNCLFLFFQPLTSYIFLLACNLFILGILQKTGITVNDAVLNLVQAEYTTKNGQINYWTFFQKIHFSLDSKKSIHNNQVSLIVCITETRKLLYNEHIPYNLTLC